MSPHVIESLAWALLNFIWQGALIGLAAGAACSALKRSRPQVRYAILLGALALMAVSPVVTLIHFARVPEGAMVPPAAQILAAHPGVVVEARLPQASPSAAGTDVFAVLVACWSGVVAFLSLRSFGGWIGVQRLARRRTTPVAETVQEIARRLSEQLGLKRAVRIVGSAVAQVPGVVGAVRPVILLPISVLTTLTPEQLEQILAHELAHIRRHDYLVNLFQTAVENVLFYHPAVWWVSGQMRAEREHCCDDLAVEICGDATAYARTLARLETLRDERPSLVLAASGGSLLGRIRRLLDVERDARPLRLAGIGALVPVTLVAFALVSVPPPEAEAAPEPRPDGFLAGLADAGYTHISVDEIIKLKHHGVEPGYIKRMLAVGLGPLDVDQLVRLHDNGVTAEFTTSIVRSGLAQGLDVENVIQLHHNGVRGDEMLRIRGLGFGPYPVADVIRLRHHGVDASTFEALKEVGAGSRGVEDAVRFREAGVTVGTVREARRQGFEGLTVEQILKLHRAGII